MKDNYGFNKAMYVAITSLPITAEYLIYRKLDSGSQVRVMKDLLLKVKPGSRKAIFPEPSINSFSK